MNKKKVLFAEVLIILLLLLLYFCGDKSVYRTEHTYTSVAEKIMAERMIQ